MSRVLNHTIKGNFATYLGGQAMYLVQGDRSSKQKAQWKLISELTHMIQDVVDYEVKRRVILDLLRRKP